MNILFFLKPKAKIEYVIDDNTVRQVMEKMDHHRFSVIPVLKESGEFVATISEGDILHFIHQHDFDKALAEEKRIKDVELYRPYKAICIDASIDELLETALVQNFVPIVDDRAMFIGIVTRQDIIGYFMKKYGDLEK